MQKKFRWGIIGPGKIAHQFAQAIHATENGILLAVGSRDLLRAREFAALYSAERSYGSYEAVIDDDEVDIVYIAVPHHLHYEYTRQCLLKGKAVLCEKPATINLRQFDQLAAISADRKVFYMDALWSRFTPVTLKMIELIAAGAVGEIKVVKADFGFKANYDPASRLFNPVMGGGSLLDIGIYPVFLSVLLLGYPVDIKANAVMAPTGIDASCNMALRYQSGAIASLYSTLLAETDNTAEISGTRGRIYLNRPFYRSTSLRLVNEEGEQSFELPFLKNGKEYEAMEVMSCLEAGLTESSLLPLSFTRDMMRLMDNVRKQIGVEYAEDVE